MHQQTPAAKSDTPAAPSKMCYTVEEAGRALGVSGRQVYNLARELGLPTVKILGRRLIRVADLQKWLDSQPLDQATTPAESPVV